MTLLGESKSGLPVCLHFHSEIQLSYQNESFTFYVLFYKKLLAIIYTKIFPFKIFGKNLKPRNKIGGQTGKPYVNHTLFRFSVHSLSNKYRILKLEQLFNYLFFINPFQMSDGIRAA